MTRRDKGGALCDEKRVVTLNNYEQRLMVRA